MCSISEQLGVVEFSKLGLRASSEMPTENKVCPFCPGHLPPLIGSLSCQKWNLCLIVTSDCLAQGRKHEWSLLSSPYMVDSIDT